MNPNDPTQVSKTQTQTQPKSEFGSELKKVNPYWKTNLKILATLLSCWFIFSLGCGILWVDYLNQFTLPGTGFKLGFWFAQQGSIIAFVLIVLIYALLMNRADKTHRAHKQA